MAFTTTRSLRYNHHTVTTLLDTHQSLAGPDDMLATPEHHLEKTDAHDPAA